MGSAASSNSKVVTVEDVDSVRHDGTPRRSLRRSSSEPRSPRSPSPSRPPSGELQRSSRRLSSKVLPFTSSSPNVKKQLVDCKNELRDSLVQFEASKERENAASKRAQQLERQVGCLESEVLDLREHISSLQDLTESQYEKQAAQRSAGSSAAAQPPECSETMLAKDGLILQLEAQIKAYQAEHNKVKARLKKKLKMAKSELTESKHESSLQVLELREEISRLMEENCSLMNSADVAGCTSGGVAGSGSSTMSLPAEDGRTSIIVNLSSQISEQAARISQLEQEITEKNSTVVELTDKIEKKREKSNRKVQRAKSMPSRALNKSKSREKHQDKGDDIVEEESDISSSSHHNNPLLMTAKADNCEMQELRAIAKEMMKVHKRRIPNADDERQSSGVSRDSGILDEGYEGKSGILDEGYEGKSQHNKRPTSATSTLSGFSTNLDEEEGTQKSRAPEATDWTWDDSDTEDNNKADTAYNMRDMRTISAPKRKLKISVSQFEYVDKLLSNSQSDVSSVDDGSARGQAVRGKPPSCGRVSSLRSPRSPSHGMSAPSFGIASPNKHLYTIGHV